MDRVSLHSEYSSSLYHGNTTLGMDLPACTATHLLYGNSDLQLGVSFQNAVRFRSTTAQACSYQVCSGKLFLDRIRTMRSCLPELFLGRGTIRYFCYYFDCLIDCSSLVSGCSLLCLELRGTILVSDEEFHLLTAQMHCDDGLRRR